MVLQLIDPALVEEEEPVIVKAVQCVSRLCRKHMLRKNHILRYVRKILPIVVHPNAWMRFAAIDFIVNAAACLPVADVECFLRPLLTPYLEVDILSVDEENLLESLKSPLSRAFFRSWLAWCPHASVC
eukprot:TRINITY_DN21736_c0_g1_i1.p1 TRINITY_DN21736_c0_g1~~TRINITY_DN21736_c0_g1_i1.p1  ORF type:complete len:128 (+),score=20.89 TRINITY_DN21736_c0_g1_i1:2-385(+)